MRIEYVHKMGNEQKLLTSYEDNDVPEKIKRIIIDNPNFSESKVFGQKEVGSPDEIEILNIELDNGQKKNLNSVIREFIL